jgi:hypothetical protein
LSGLRLDSVLFFVFAALLVWFFDFSFKQPAAVLRRTGIILYHVDRHISYQYMWLIRGSHSRSVRLTWKSKQNLLVGWWLNDSQH